MKETKISTNVVVFIVAAAAVPNRKNIQKFAKKLDFWLEFPTYRCIIYANLLGTILIDLSYVIVFSQPGLPLIIGRISNQLIIFSLAIFVS